MSRHRYLAGVGNFFGAMGSAIAVSAAVRDRRAANPADLSRLGIDPEQFQRIRYR
ncbi:hypothetical protein [Chelativorans sp. YIM 93263]|uniref:hypothetical protein n=1 Tax=Chelativorans sp. YIM 93263 TaxID=2906648 RepID=UPI0023792A14|nr:hypothetical protein [Chelativorans sp. YIM 93263]